LINQSKNEATYLHEAALSALKALRLRFENQPASAAPIFIALTSSHTVGIFDLEKFPVTKTLEQIVQTADDDSLRKIVRHLASLILRPDTKDQDTADIRRQKIADLLLYAVRNYKRYGKNTFVDTEEHDNWLRNALGVLVDHGYFNPTTAAKTSKVPLPPISEGTRKVFQERLSSCLTKLLDVETDTQAAYASLILGLIQSKATSKTKELVFKADDVVMETIEKAFEAIEKLNSKVRFHT
jgi:DNA polymerase phi